MIGIYIVDYYQLERYSNEALLILLTMIPADHMDYDVVLDILTERGAPTVPMIGDTE